MDTLAVALRVAEEAIEEAISKAEAYGDSLVQPLSSSLWGGVGQGGGEKLRVVGKPASQERCPTSPCICGQDSPKVRLSPPNPSLAPRPFSSLPLQDKQHEASYLRDHKEELTEELATTILQKVSGPAWHPMPAFTGPRADRASGELKSSPGHRCFRHRFCALALLPSVLWGLTQTGCITL